MKIKIAPSILAADFSRLGEEIARAEKGGADLIHIDVMDGLFVPNITVGLPVVASLKSKVALPLDVHLMIEEPIRYVERFSKAGASILTVHAEACTAVGSTLKKIKACGAKVGLSIKPGTPLSAIIRYLTLTDMVLLMTVEPGFGGQKFMEQVLPKISALRRIYRKDIEVDGGINLETASLAVAAGANVLVSGESIFGSGHAARAIAQIRSKAEAAACRA